MPLVTRGRSTSPRVSRARQAAEFDRAVAEFFMKIAVEEARHAVGRTSPNPPVGAILVKGGRIIARGHTQKVGGPHAEAMALAAAGKRARGADLYSTLEPCDHFGRTPPCSKAILAAGVRRVICGSSDPNPLVNGKGVARLRRGGVPVLTGVCREETDRLNRAFFTAIQTGRPMVTLKAAATLDGKLATATGDSRWVTGPAAREQVHRLRDQVDAILVGANTVEKDDPALTTRLPGGEGRDAMRVVVDSRLRLSTKHQVFRQRSTARTVVATLAPANGAKAKALRALGVEVWTVRGKDGKVSLRPLLERLAKAGCNHVLVEGGARLFGTFLREKLADELWLYLAPKLIGASGLSWIGEIGVLKMARAVKLSGLRVERVGEDVLLRADLKGA